MDRVKRGPRDSSMNGLRASHEATLARLKGIFMNDEKRGGGGPRVDVKRLMLAQRNYTVTPV